MTVTVDHEPLAVGDLGFQTVGQVLSHLQNENRMVVQVLIDGQEPQPGQLAAMRQTALAGHCVYIETADPRILALEVIEEICQQLQSAEQFKAEAAQLLQQGQMPRALQQLNSCLRIWQDAQDAIHKTAELLRIDLDALRAGDRPLREALSEFAEQLRAVRNALGQRDFVSLGDVLAYETAQTTSNWLACMEAMRNMIHSIR